MIPALFPVSGIVISSPLDVSGCVLWLDGDDTATISPGSADGTSISQWNDKSGNSYHVAQAAGSQKPVYKTAIQNGRNIIRFDGGDDVLQSGTITILSSVSAWTAFSVSRPTSIANQVVYGIQTQSGPQHFIFQALLTTTGYTRFYGVRLYTDAAQYLDDTTARSTSVFEIISGIATFGSTLTIYKNGTQTNQVGTYMTSGSSAAAQNKNLYIGGTGAPTVIWPFGGDVAEVIMYNSALSPADHSRVVDYLKTKWNL